MDSDVDIARTFEWKISYPQLSSRSYNDTPFNNLNTSTWLQKYPRGAYTTMRSWKHVFKLLDWNGHLNRLFQSFDAINSEKIILEVKEKKLLSQKLPQFVSFCIVRYLEQSSCKDDIRIAILITSDSSKYLIVAIRIDSIPFQPEYCTVQFIKQLNKRINPNAKDTKWTFDRRSMESLMISSVTNDMIMYDNEEDGNILEGLQSNFFCIKKPKENGNNLSLFELCTAPIKSVLFGSIMRILLDLCEKHYKGSLNIKFQHPCIYEIHEWKGAFITSTSRLILPIKTILNSNGQILCDFDSIPEIVLELRKMVENSLTEYTVCINPDSE